MNLYYDEKFKEDVIITHVDSSRLDEEDCVCVHVIPISHFDGYTDDELIIERLFTSEEFNNLKRKEAPVKVLKKLIEVLTEYVLHLEDSNHYIRSWVG